MTHRFPRPRNRPALIAWCFLFTTLCPLEAEVVHLANGEGIEIPLRPIAPGTDVALRTIYFLGADKMTVSGVWTEGDLEVQQRGNALTLGLRNAKPGPIALVITLADGRLYHLRGAVAAADAVLEPTIHVVNGTPAPSTTAKAPSDTDGGSWEHITNQVLRLHLHIRGGAPASDAHGSPVFNRRLLEEQGVRQLGDPISEEDDFRIVEYHRWSLGQVQASYLGLLYRGRETAVSLPYGSLETDQTVAIWHEDVSGQGVLDPRQPLIPLVAGVEQRFLLYRRIQP